MRHIFLITYLFSTSLFASSAYQCEIINSYKLTENGNLKINNALVDKKIDTKGKLSPRIFIIDRKTGNLTGNNLEMYGQNEVWKVDQYGGNGWGFAMHNDKGNMYLSLIVKEYQDSKSKPFQYQEYPFGNLITGTCNYF